MRIAVGNDHRGCDLKTTVITAIMDAGHTVRDFGCFTEDAVDYPEDRMSVV